MTPDLRRRAAAAVRSAVLLLAALGGACARPLPEATPASGDAAPLAIGETFTMASSALGERRRINVYLPPGYRESPTSRVPVLYMPDGGIAEDFLHVAGLVQVLVGNGTMRPFMVVGIENTERRRDMTGPTQVDSDRRIAARVGGSAAFRAFVKGELMPRIRDRYRTTGETAIVGESLAGLFVTETFLAEPTLFDTYIAFDPSLWWNDRALIRGAEDGLRTAGAGGRRLYLATSGDGGMGGAADSLVTAVRRAVPAVRASHARMPEERHATIYHPAALRAFRELFAPAPSR